MHRRLNKNTNFDTQLELLLFIKVYYNNQNED